MKVLRALFYILLLANLVLVFVSLGGFSRAPGGEPERLSSQLHPEQIRILSQDSPEDSSAESAPAESAPTPSASDSAPAQADAANDSAESAEARKAEAKKAEEARKSEEAKKAEEAKRAAELKKEEEQKKLAEARKAEEAKKLAASPACASWAGLSRVQADEIVQRSRSAGLKSQISNAGAPSAWWVHLPAQSDRAGAERKAAELRSLGVSDFFIVNDAGPNQNAISLGLYKNEDSAKRMLEQLKASGVQTARISTREASQLKVEVSGASASLSAFTSQNRFPSAHASCTPAKR